MKDSDNFILEGKNWFERYTKTIREYAEKIQESEEWFSTTLNSIGDAVIAIDKLGKINFINPVAIALTGWKQEEAIGSPLEEIFNIINEETRKKVENPVSRVLREGVVVGLANHTVLITKDGKEIPLIDIGAPLKGVKGNIIGVILIFRDITARRKMEESNRALMEGVTSVGIGVDIVSRDYIIIFQNQTLEVKFGNSIGKLCYEIYMGLKEPCAFCPMIEAIKCKKVQHTELLGSDGKHYDLFSAPYPNPDGTIDKAFEIVMDITERKKAEQELRETQKKMESYFNLAGTVFLALSKDGIITLLNKKGHDILQYNEGELIDKNWFDICLPEHAYKDTFEIFKKFLKGDVESGEFVENNVITKTGEERTIAWYNTLLYDNEENIVGTLSSGEDITERKNSEQNIRLLSSAVEQSTEGIAIADLDGNLSFINDAWCKMHGYKNSKELLGKNLAIFHNKEQLENDVIPFNEKVKKFGTHGGEVGHINKDGKPFPTIMTSTILKDDQDKPYAIVGIAKDITERKKAEQKLRVSESLYRIAYDRANFYKDLFAHDMNNILQAILSGLQLSEMVLENPDNLEDLKTNLRIMKNQIMRGSNLISNVRKLSQLEEIEIPLKKIEICVILKNLITTLKNTYHTKNLNIQIRSIGKKLYVQANDFLVDVFENILINSIRYNGNSTVEITVKVSRTQKNSVNYLKVEFQDNGIGISNTRKETIFKRGFSKEKSFQGMGLGLSLVKKIIDNYNGEIWVEDRIKGDHSKGANFILLIPEVN